jgi:hypothetical protein
LVIGVGWNIITNNLNGFTGGDLVSKGGLKPNLQYFKCGSKGGVAIRKCSPLPNEMFVLKVFWFHVFQIPTTQAKAKVGYLGALNQFKENFNNKTKGDCLVNR